MLRKICIALLLASFALGAIAQPAPALKKFRVLLPFRDGITFFPLSTANQLGYLKEEGIDLDLQVVNGSSAVVQQLAAGNAQMAVILAPNTLLGFAEGVKYKAFYDFLTRNTFDVKVLPDAPINKLADLKGKNIGTIDLTRGDLPLLRAQLQRAGLTPARDVTFVALGPTMSVHALALKEGKVQALNLSWNNTVSVEAVGGKLKCITCDCRKRRGVQAGPPLRRRARPRDGEGDAFCRDQPRRCDRHHEEGGAGGAHRPGLHQDLLQRRAGDHEAAPAGKIRNE